MSGNWWVEIVFLAMLAGFIALRLVSVLGRRTGHEGAPAEGFRGGVTEQPAASGSVVDIRARPALDLPADIDPALRDGLTAIAAADPSFDPARFTDGAKSAYRMILEAFWKGDIAEVEAFVSDDVGDSFRRAIAQRADDGVSVENRIVAIDRAAAVSAHIDGNMAEVAVRFDAQIVAVTRDRDGRLIDGSATDAAATADEWTFRRHLAASDPSWLLVATETLED